jgi:hypothetical protein
LIADPVPAPDPSLIASDFEDGYWKIITGILSKFFLLITFCGHIYISQTTSHKEVTKPQKSRFFLIFLVVDGRIWIRTNNYGWYGKMGTGTFTRYFDIIFDGQ